MKKRIILVLMIIAVIALGAVALVSCNRDKDADTPQNIAYDGQYITWSKVDGANHYTVSINGGEAKRSNSTTFAYVSTESFEVTVTAVFDKKEKSASITFSPLAKITNISVSNNGELSWESVSGASAYSISINGTVETITDTAYTKLPTGTNRVKIKPIVAGDTSFYSDYSDEISVFIYESPTNIKYDGVNITWSGNASSYEIKVNGTTSTVSGNTFAYNSESKDFEIEIKALGNHTSTYDSKPTTESFHYLSGVTDITVEDGIVKWNAIEGATGYKIRIGNVVQKETVTDTEYRNLAEGKSQDVAIMPFNDTGNYFSTWSAIKTVYILNKPTISWNNDLNLDGEANNNLTWNAVNVADGYTVRLIKDGGVPEIKTFSSIQRAFSHAYADVGVYTVEVKANAPSDNADNYDSRYSAPITIQRLPSPEAAINDFIVSDPDNINTGFTVNFEQVNGASGYQLYKDGALLNGKYTTNASISDNNVADTSNIAEQHYTYVVRSMGGVRTESGKKYVTLPCLTSQALSFDITVQATPLNLSISGYNLTWDNITGNNGYTVAYAGATSTAQIERFDMSVIKAGTYSFSVSARGNGSSTLASTRSAPVAVERLEAPTNITISANGNGTLQWNDVSNAKSYETYLDLSKTPLNETAYGNMYQFIETNGTTLSMIAVANYYNESNNLYYMSSEVSPTQQFIRLSAPSFPEGAISNSQELVWNTPDNINTAEYTPTYRVYSAIGEQIGGGDINGTKFNIEYLEEGKSYKFIIKAIGNSTKYLDSDYSTELTIYKLEKPKLTIENGKYVWNGVSNASSYYLEIDGKKVSDDYHVSGNKYTYAPRFTTEGDHIVKLKAVGDGRTNADSEYLAYTQKARILLSPEIKYSYSENVFVKGGKITVEITNPTANCSGYQYEIAGQSTVSSELSFSKVIESAGKYSIRVKAVGGVFDENNVYCIDSQYVGGASSDVITLLSTPATSSFTITSDGAVKWGQIAGAYGYEYQISYDGAEFGDIAKSNFNTIKIDGHLKYRTISIKVRACGDGGKTVTGEWVEWTWTNSNM